LVAVVVGAVVVEGTEQGSVGEVGFAASGPGFVGVMRFGLARVSRTAT
jgi:hypothetical protein